METYSRLFVALMIGVVFGIITGTAPHRKTSSHLSYQEYLTKNRTKTNLAKKKQKLSQANTQKSLQTKKHVTRYKNL